MLYTCKIVNYFKLLIYFWQRGQIVGGTGCRKGQGGGGKKGGRRGWGKGGGVRGEQGGGIYIKMMFSTKQVS